MNTQRLIVSPTEALSETCPAHITGRFRNRLEFDIPLKEVWLIMENQLYFLNRAFDIQIHVFLLMPNHYHSEMSAPQNNWGEASNYFMRETSREIGKAAGRINQTWGGPHSRTDIRSNHHFRNAYKYIYQNPVRAGLVQRVEDWPYSTLPGLIGEKKLVIPTNDPFLFNPTFDPRVLDWLNVPISERHCESMKIALGKKQFRLPRNFTDKGRNPLEDEPI